MVDTGGDAGLGGSRRKGRTKLKKYVALKGGIGGRTAGGGGGRGGGGSGKEGDGPLTTVLTALDNVGVLEDVFTAPELIHYLQWTARLIQKSEGGAQKAAEVFSLTPDSAFSAWQRKVRVAAPGNAASGKEGSDHHIRALRAFQGGSSKWGLSVTKTADLTVVTMKTIVIAIAPRIDTQLLAAPRAILDEYLDQVVASFIAGDPALLSLSATIRKDYRTRLDAFFTKFSKPEQWIESRIPATMKNFPAILHG